MSEKPRPIEVRPQEGPVNSNDNPEEIGALSLRVASLYGVNLQAPANQPQRLTDQRIRDQRGILRPPTTQFDALHQPLTRAQFAAQDMLNDLLNLQTVRLTTVERLQHTNSTLTRVRAWNESQLAGPENRNAVRTRFQLMIENLDQNRTIIEYQNALTVDFLKVAHDYAVFCGTPDGKAARLSILNQPGNNLLAQEARVQGILREMEVMIPLLQSIGQVRLYRQMLRIHEHPVTKLLSEITLPENSTVEQLRREHPNDAKVRDLHDALQAEERGLSLATLRRTYRSLEDQIGGPEIAARFRGAGALEDAFKGRIRVLSGHVEELACQLTAVLPSQAAPGAKPVDRESLAYLLQHSGTPLENLDEYANHLEKRWRDGFRIGEEFAPPGGPRASTQTAHFLYERVTRQRTDDIGETLKDPGTIKLGDLVTFYDSYIQSSQASLRYHRAQLTQAGEFSELLGFRGHIGQETRTMTGDADPEQFRLRRIELERLREIAHPELAQEVVDEGMVWRQGIDHYMTGVTRVANNFSGMSLEAVVDWIGQRSVQAIKGFDDLLLNIENTVWDFSAHQIYLGWPIEKIAEFVGLKQGDPNIPEELKNKIKKYRENVLTMRQIANRYLERSRETHRRATDTQNSIKEFHDKEKGVPVEQLALAPNPISKASVEAMMAMNPSLPYIDSGIRDDWAAVLARHTAAQTAYNRDQTPQNLTEYRSADTQLHELIAKVAELQLAHYYYSRLKGIPSNKIAPADRARWEDLKIVYDAKWKEWKQKSEELSALPQNAAGRPALVTAIRRLETQLYAWDVEIRKMIMPIVVKEFKDAREELKKIAADPARRNELVRAQNEFDRASMAAHLFHLRLMSDLQLVDIPAIVDAVEEFDADLRDKRIGSTQQEFDLENNNRLLRILSSALGVVSPVPGAALLYGGYRFASTTGSLSVRSLRAARAFGTVMKTPYTVASYPVRQAANFMWNAENGTGPSSNSFWNRFSANSTPALSGHQLQFEQGIRGTRAIQALETGVRGFQLAGRNAQLLAQAVEAAHILEPTGRIVSQGGVLCSDGLRRLWSTQDLVKKMRILKIAKFLPAESKFLLRTGWCGLELSSLAETISESGGRLTPASAGAIALEGNAAATGASRILAGAKTTLRYVGRAAFVVSVAAEGTNVVLTAAEIPEAHRYRDKLFSELMKAFEPLTEGANAQYRREGDTFTHIVSGRAVNLQEIRTMAPNRALLQWGRTGGALARGAGALGTLGLTELLGGALNKIVPSFGESLSAGTAESYIQFIQSLPLEVYGLLPLDRLFGEHPLETWNRLPSFALRIAQDERRGDYMQDQGRVNGARSTMLYAMALPRISRYSGILELLGNQFTPAMLGGDYPGRTEGEPASIMRRFDTAPQFETASELNLVLSIRNTIFNGFVGARGSIIRHDLAVSQARELLKGKGRSASEVDAANFETLQNLVQTESAKITFGTNPFTPLLPHLLTLEQFQTANDQILQLGNQRMGTMPMSQVALELQLDDVLRRHGFLGSVPSFGNGSSMDRGMLDRMRRFGLYELQESFDATMRAIDTTYTESTDMTKQILNGVRAEPRASTENRALTESLFGSSDTAQVPMVVTSGGIPERPEGNIENAIAELAQNYEAVSLLVGTREPRIFEVRHLELVRGNQRYEAIVGTFVCVNEDLQGRPVFFHYIAMRPAGTDVPFTIYDGKQTDTPTGEPVSDTPSVRTADLDRHIATLSGRRTGRQVEKVANNVGPEGLLFCAASIENEPVIIEGTREDPKVISFRSGNSFHVVTITSEGATIQSITIPGEERGRNQQWLNNPQAVLNQLRMPGSERPVFELTPEERAAAATLNQLVRSMPAVPLDPGNNSMRSILGRIRLTSSPEYVLQSLGERLSSRVKDPKSRELLLDALKTAYDSYRSGQHTALSQMDFERGVREELLAHPDRSMQSAQDAGFFASLVVQRLGPYRGE